MPIDPSVLRNSTIFQLLDDEELRELAGHIDEGSFRAGQTIFKAGEAGGTMHVVLEGKVETFVIDDDQERVVLAEVGPGEMFGELSLLDGDPRSASALAVEPTRTFVIDRDDLERLFVKKPHAALEILTTLSRRIRKTDLLIRQRAAKNANEVIDEESTFGERVADQVAKFGGSWSFIFLFGTTLVVWVLLNTLLLFGRPEPFDPYPFILLNLFLSMLAAIQAPVIMMSQNRQDTKDRVRSELDYQVNLKAEVEIMQLHEKVDRLEEELLRRIPAPPTGK